MANILRGDIYWANLNPTLGHEQSGIRPVLVLSQDVFNKHSGTIIAIAITSQKQRADYPLTMQIKSVKLPKPSWIKISQIRTLSTKRITTKIGRLSTYELNRAVQGLLQIIG